MLRLLVPAVLACGVLLAAFATPISPRTQDVQIQVVPVAGGISMLTGQGGNIGVSAGEDGVLLIDDQFAQLTERIKTAVAGLSNQPIRFLLNTHFHFDHTGGNEAFAKAGAMIVAHENVRARLSTKQVIKAFNSEMPPAPPKALPVITYADRITFHWNGDTVSVFHVAPAHTDGDSVIYFEKANVVHMGDTYFNGMYPFIDTDSGGNIDGMIAAAKQVLDLANESTKIIPGHGPLSNQQELRVYHDMLSTVRGRMATLIAAGKTKEQVLAEKPSKDFDEAWGKVMLKPDQWVGIVYDGMVKATGK